MQESSKLALSRSHQPLVLEQWHSFIEHYEMSCDEFYKRVEAKLQERKIPDLNFSRVTWNEGGLLSANREYLRLSRERWSFDICAAPFGTGYFFSYRFIETPLKPDIIALLCIMIVIAEVIYFLMWHTLNSPTAVIGLFALFCFGIYFLFLGTTDETRFSSLDSILLQIPIVRTIYDRFFRRETYYREDTRLMYLATVPAVVKKVVEEVTAAKGVSKPNAIAGKPVLAELAGAV